MKTAAAELGPNRRRRPAPRALATRTVSIASILVLIGFVGWFFLQAGTFEDLMREPEAPVNTPSPSISDVNSANFSGFNKSDEPYNVTAATAIRDENNPAKVYLTTVRGELKLKVSGEVMIMTANNGVYKSDERILGLNGDVKVVSSENYTAYLKDARIDIETKQLTSENPVHVIFDEGTIDSNKIEMWDNGNRILFKDNVRMKLTGKGNKGNAE